MAAEEFISRTIVMCRACYELKGAVCNNPDCVFCRRTMAEVRRILDELNIRPVINGKRERL